MTGGTEDGQGVTETVRPMLIQIEHLFAGMKSDLEGDKFWRYQRAISPGLQEYVEALSFAHYLTYDSLIAWKEVQDRLSDESGIPVRCLPFLALHVSRVTTCARIVPLCLRQTATDKEHVLSSHPDRTQYFPLPIEDYLLGVSDLTGELMRYAIAGIPRKGGRATANTVCTFVRQCKADFGTLTPHSRELAKKQRVTVESLHKIEDGALHRHTFI